MNTFQNLKDDLKANPKTWLITGVAGFIGSNLLESLLDLDQKVVGLDNFSTGFQHNLDEVKTKCSDKWQNFSFIEGDICNLDHCRKSFERSIEVFETKTDYVLHQAALGSVPRSIANPIATNSNNVTGFLNILTASRDSQVKRFVYAASSSAYGDNSDSIKTEDCIGAPLSPYAVSKRVNEMYAQVYSQLYPIQTVGLRYFNVFGPRQNPTGSYAAVIPLWINDLLHNKKIIIFGDGNTSRDFCFVKNVVQANLLACLTSNTEVAGQVFNVACNQTTSLKQLHSHINSILKKHDTTSTSPLEYKPFRTGDILHSLADISKAKIFFNYTPTDSLYEGLEKTIPWFIKKVSQT